MTGKPVVALVLPALVSKQMFDEGALAQLRQHAEVIGPVEPKDQQQFFDALRRATAAITGWRSPMFDAEILAAAVNLKLIAHSAGSVKGVVGEAVYDRGIRVTTSAAANAQPVAQFTVAMMIALLKQVPWLAQAYASGDVSSTARRKALCRELQDLDVGIIAASRVGREVIRLLQAYPRLRIKLYDPHVKPEQASALGAQLVSLEDACRCEVVSIHAPGIPATKHMFNARTLALLPDHAVLINTSRGALIDEAALVAELNRRPLYVAMDVTDPEPLPLGSPLRTAPNVILTPHIAGALRQGRRDMGAMAVDQVIRFLQGRPLEHEVTRGMLPTQA